MLSKLDHAVLNDVQRGVLIADVIDAAFERAFFHAFQEIGEFLFGCQKVSFSTGSIPNYGIASVRRNDR